MHLSVLNIGLSAGVAIFVSKALEDVVAVFAERFARRKAIAKHNAELQEVFSRLDKLQADQKAAERKGGV